MAIIIRQGDIPEHALVSLPCLPAPAGLWVLPPGVPQTIGALSYKNSNPLVIIRQGDIPEHALVSLPCLPAPAGLWVLPLKGVPQTIGALFL